MNEEDLIKSFIEDEELAFKMDEQGIFYSDYHYQINDIAKSGNKKWTEETFVLLYYHLFRRGKLIKPHKIHFLSYQKAFEKLLSVLNLGYPKNSFKKLESSFLFDAITPDTKDIKNIYSTTYEEFVLYLSAINQCNKYTRYSNMRHKKEKFLPYAQNKSIINRISTALRKSDFQHEGFIFDYTLGGFILMLILSNSTTSMDTLREFIEKTKDPKSVFLLADFLKEFQSNSEIKMLLEEVHKNHPKEWIEKLLY